MSNAHLQQKRRFENIVQRKPPPEDLPVAIKVNRKKYSLNGTQVECLRDATSAFLSLRQVYDRWPRASETKTNLKSLIKAGRLFLNTLHRLDHPTKSLLFSVRTGMIGEINTEALKNVQSIVVRLIECSEEALKSIPPDKGGRKAKLSFKFYVQNLAAIYEGVTGQKPSVFWSDIKNKYQGPFFVFVNACLRSCNQSPGSQKALGKALRRILKGLSLHPPIQP